MKYCLPIKKEREVKDKLFLSDKIIAKNKYPLIPP